MAGHRTFNPAKIFFIVGFDSHHFHAVGSLPNDVSVAKHLTENDNANREIYWNRTRRYTQEAEGIGLENQEVGNGAGVQISLSPL